MPRRKLDQAPPELPSTSEAFFRDVYQRIGEREGTRWTSEEGRQKAELGRQADLERIAELERLLARMQSKPGEG